jgi:hypothetical protein
MDALMAMKRYRTTGTDPEAKDISNRKEVA